MILSSRLSGYQEQPEGDLVESGGKSSLFADLSSSIPGIDEAMSFGELLKTVKSMVRLRSG